MNLDQILKTLDLTHQDFWMIIIFGLFFVLVWRLLDQFLFGPYLALIETREALTSEAGIRATETQSQADELQRQYDSKLMEQRIASMREKLTRTATAKQEAAKILEKAKDEADKYIHSVRTEIDEKLVSLTRDAYKEVEVLSEDLVQRITQTGAR